MHGPTAGYMANTISHVALDHHPQQHGNKQLRQEHHIRVLEEPEEHFRPDDREEADVIDGGAKE